MEWMKLQLNRKRRMAVVLVALVSTAAPALYWGDGASAAPYDDARVERGSCVTPTATANVGRHHSAGRQAASGTISRSSLLQPT